MNWRVHYCLIPNVSVLRRFREAGFSVTVHPDAVSAAVESANAGQSVLLTASVSHSDSHALTLFLLRYSDLRITVDD